MTSAAELGPVEQVSALGALLKARKIETVLFIDDGFDPLSQQEPSREQQDEIWAIVQADELALNAALQLGVEDAGHFTAEMVEQTLSGPAEALRPVLESSSYVVEYRSKGSALTAVVEYLRRLNIEVRTHGVNDWRDHIEGVQLVFLDWRLGPDRDPASMHVASTAAREIHKRPNRPYLVLISSDPGVKNASVAFSEASGLVCGMFDAMPKAWLANEVDVTLNLTVILDLYAAGDAVQSFVEALRTHADTAVQSFLKRIERLTVSDYANLQHLALRKDGHPLGDYLTELFAGLWTDTLFQGELKSQLVELDKQDFGSLPALTGPSDALADLYNSAVFDTHVGALAPHPHASADDQTRLQLSLGDVLVERKEGKVVRAYTILNPQCDLAESPRGSRRIPDDLSILLVPGDIEAIDHAQRTERREAGDTPFLKVDGVAKRVHWSGRSIENVPYAGFADWLSKDRERIARMRPVHGLALQRTVFAELTRVGLPNPPPIHDPVGITLSRAVFGKWSKEGDSTGQQGRFVMARDSKGDRIVFTHSFLVEIASALRQGLDEATSRRNDWKGKDEAALTVVGSSLGDPAEWRRLSQPFPLPDGGLKLFGDGLLVCTKKPTEGMSRKLLVCVTVDLPSPST
ncbi:hypothetical protein ACQKQD_24050 [Methylobacterium sp. NPDC080182]|uniref:hypothetical protein n=1 Tax=Methylobacterium sp. NPDC080182 TaxID=3390590 RepID=UPI003CFE0EEE